MSVEHAQINIEGSIFLVYSPEWEQGLRERFKAAGLKWSRAFYRFASDLARFCFDGKPRLWTIREIGARVDLCRTQVKEHLETAYKVGIFKKIRTSWRGLHLKLLTVSVPPSKKDKQEEPTAPAPAAPVAKAAPVAEAAPAPTPSSRFTPQERRRAAEFAADEYEECGGKTRNRMRLVHKILGEMSDEQVADNLEALAKREAARSQAAERKSREENERREQQIALEAACARHLAQFNALPQAEQQAIKEAVIERLPKTQRDIIRRVGSIELTTNALILENYEAALQKELQGRFAG